MPWCPKCDNEYRTGITVCPDCGVALRENKESLPDDTEYEFLVSIKENEIAEKLMKYYRYLEISAKMEKNEEGICSISVDSRKLKEAATEFKVFYKCEAENKAFQIMNGSEDNDADEEDFDTSEEETIEKQTENDSKVQDDLHQKRHTAGVYKKASERYEDYIASGKILIAFGIIGTAFIVCNMLGLLTIINGLFSQLIMLVFFIAMGITGIGCAKKAVVIKGEIAQENALRTKVMQWLSDTFTAEELNRLEGIAETEEELRYYQQTAYIKEHLQKEFPDLDESFAEALLDEFYTSIDL